jgi:C4-dicarboxylate-specific signal transduction histidine kinase
MKKGEPVKESLDMNSVVEEILALTEGEMSRNEVVLQTELAADLPAIPGDRVQLQQVLLNLIMNGIEAMSAVKDRARILRIRSAQQGPDDVLVAVQDSGIGIDPAQWSESLTPFIPRSRAGWGLDCPSVAQLSRHTVGASGPR